MKFFRASRFKYWGSNKLTAWLYKRAKLAKPQAATAEEWEDWNTNTSRQAKFATWLDNALDQLQHYVMFPFDVWYSIRLYIRNRYFTRTHLLVTDLEPGLWHEFDNRLLHGMFGAFADFIETENAASELYFRDKAERRRICHECDISWTAQLFSRWITIRSPKMGIRHLTWEIGLTKDKDWGLTPDDAEWGKPTPQAAAAKETLELYLWWKNRKFRPDPAIASGWMAEYEAANAAGTGVRGLQLSSTSGSLERMDQIEEAYNKEDEEMMHKLIKMRGYMWT